MALGKRVAVQNNSGVAPALGTPANLQAVVDLYRSGKVREAGKKARKLLRRSPRTLVLYDILAAALIAEDKLTDAVACYRKALKTDPNHLNAHCNLGVLLRRLGKPDDAVASSLRALEIDPDHVQTLNNLGLALRDIGDLEGAVTRYRQALAHEPGYAAAHSNLGIVLKDLERYEESAVSHREAVRLQPGSSEVHNNLGNTLVCLEKFEEAAQSYGHSLRIAPDSGDTLTSFAGALRHIASVKTLMEFQDLIAQCFENAAIPSKWLDAASHAALRTRLNVFQSAESLSLDDIAALDDLTGGLLIAHLEKRMIADASLEVLLARVRRLLLETREDSAPEAFEGLAIQRLLRALAQLSFLNEYIWHVSVEEDHRVTALENGLAHRIQNGSDPEETDLYLLAAYRPLYQIASIRDWALKQPRDTGTAIGRLLQTVVCAPEQERHIKDGIEILTSIDDVVSKAVRSQYEENPYPRWSSIAAAPSADYAERIVRAIAPHKPQLELTSSAPEVLIAGCGTGQHPIGSALAVRTSNLLAIDLSKASLAFAERKARELGVTNVRFAQADILRLGELDDTFDVIECGGVLHHMADPEAGLSVLLDRLKPGGFFNIALYSEIARESIVRMRELVAEESFASTLEGIREFRQFVRQSDHPDLAAIQRMNDFYSTSEIRDLIFHVQEHRFTIPQIAALLDRHSLEFLGFAISDPRTKTRYQEQFPDDPDCLDLANWSKYEQENPKTFTEMYQFWCRKPA